MRYNHNFKANEIVLTDFEDEVWEHYKSVLPNENLYRGFRMMNESFFLENDKIVITKDSYNLTVYRKLIKTNTLTRGDFYHSFPSMLICCNFSIAGFDDLLKTRSLFQEGYLTIEVPANFKFSKRKYSSV